MSLAAATHLGPDVAVLVFTVGVLLIYVELNRPGWIVPGALGLLLALLAAVSLSRLQLSPAALALLASAIALMLLSLLRRTVWLVCAAATLALVLGLDRLVLGPAPLHIHTAVAACCGLLLGTGTSVLTLIARRARANKAVD